jgi:hypothetical protein
MAIFPLILHVQQRTGSAFAVSALIFALWGPVPQHAELGVAGVHAALELLQAPLFDGAERLDLHCGSSSFPVVVSARG